MLRRLYYYTDNSVDPFANLALEAYLTSTVQPDEAVLYLWQNRKTVVIGKNQNPWKECRIRELEEADGKLVRRLSGGGAVFHDLGNLNFTFIASNENYDIPKQMQVILEAVRSFGVSAELSGRNDLTVGEKKFSGNAFYNNGVNSYHHGTLLIDVDMENLSRYLNVSAAKLASKGVDSVRSRVTNLNALNKEITVDSMKPALAQAFSRVYGLPVESLPNERLNRQEIAALREKFSSWEWCFGRKLPFTYSLSHRFAWGEIELQLAVNEGKIQNAALYSDAMEWRGFSETAAALEGCVFSAKEIAACLDKFSENWQGTELFPIVNDLKNRILQEDF